MTSNGLNIHFKFEFLNDFFPHTKCINQDSCNWNLVPRMYHAGMLQATMDQLYTPSPSLTY